MSLLSEEDLKKLPHKFQIMFAVFCAKQVIHLVLEKDKEVCIKAIKAAEGFIEGTITKKQANAAAHAATYAAAHAAYAAYAANAANAAAYAANAAAHAAHAAYAAANKEQIVKEQREYYDELLNFEKNFEEIMLGVRL